MSATALVILAEGSEEMEAVITTDVLRRAGVDVTIAGLTGSDPVKCSRNVVIVPDASLEEAAKKSYNVVILPGGLKGAQALAESEAVGKILMEQEKLGKVIAAICAAPFALKAHGLCAGKSLTSHPCMQKELSDGTYTYLEDRVVVDGKVITSRAPGTAFEFALAIVRQLLGQAKVDEISPSMILKK